MARHGRDTKSEAERVALDLFTRQGYDATSMREVAEVLGVTKAALYYHFRGKEDIVAALLDARADDAEALLEWVRSRPRDDDLALATALRWIDSTTGDGLSGIRFANANPGLLHRLPGAARIGRAFTSVVAELAPDPDEGLRLRMGLVAVESALLAARGTDAEDRAIVEAAREAAVALLGR